MGCSYTEGVGCWDYSKFTDKVKDKISNWKSNDPIFHDGFMDEIDDRLHYKSFHEKGWPNKVGKILGFDKVINYGVGGDSNSAQAKRFYEKHFDKELYKDWDVTVIWLLTFSGRISFYMGRNHRNYQYSNLNAVNGDDLSEVYFKDLIESNEGNIEGVDTDISMETIYYFNTVESICKLNNYKIFGLFFTDTDCESIKNTYKGSSILPFNVMFFPNRPPLNSYSQSNLNSIICGHPNEEGYKLIAKNISSILINNLKMKVNTYKPKLFEWEYMGDVEHIQYER